MSRLVTLCAVSVILAAGLIAAMQDAPKPTEIQTLQMQLHAAKSQLLSAQLGLAQCQAQAQAADLTRERHDLERIILAGKDGYEIDWATGTLKAKPKADSPKK